MVWVSREVFDHVRPGRLSHWQRGRVVDNEGEVVAALQAAVRVRPTRSLVGMGALTCVVSRNLDPLASRVTRPSGVARGSNIRSDSTGPARCFASVHCSNSHSAFQRHLLVQLAHCICCIRSAVVKSHLTKPIRGFQTSLHLTLLIRPNMLWKPPRTTSRWQSVNYRR